jgi:uncharacterized cupredoxin-like copper-binding protein
MKRLSLIAALLAAGALSFATAAHDQEKHPYGEPGDAKDVKRTITVTMSDTMRFNPSRITVKRGETIRFVVKNAGELKHEMTLGTIAELKEHAALMQKLPEMEHEEPNMVTVEPGKTGEMIWKFSNAGTVDFACLVPGHYESGMTGKIVVNR